MSDAERIKLIERALDDGGRQLEAAAHFGTSADQRAVTLASVYIATATGLIAGLAGFGELGEIPTRYMIAGMVAVLGFYVGGAVCVWAAFPVTFFSGGNPPEFWQFHLDKGSTYEAALVSQMEEYESKIAENKAILQHSAKLFRAGALLGVASPAFALVILYLPV